MRLQTGECLGFTLLQTFLIAVPFLFVIDWCDILSAIRDVWTIQQKKNQFEPVVSEISAFKWTNFHLYKISIDCVSSWLHKFYFLKKKLWMNAQFNYYINIIHEIQYLRPFMRLWSIIHMLLMIPNERNIWLQWFIFSVHVFIWNTIISILWILLAAITKFSKNFLMKLSEKAWNVCLLLDAFDFFTERKTNDTCMKYLFSKKLFLTNLILNCHQANSYIIFITSTFSRTLFTSFFLAPLMKLVSCNFLIIFLSIFRGILLKYRSLDLK